jgi:hypothetical protein
VSSSWSATIGSTVTSIASGATTIRQAAGYRACDRGDVQWADSVRRTPLHPTGTAAPRGGTKVPEEKGVALPSGFLMR